MGGGSVCVCGFQIQKPHANVVLGTLWKEPKMNTFVKSMLQVVEYF